MKKLVFIVVIITLPILAFFQYKSYRRFHPPINYDYQLNPNIDSYYYDQEMVKEYFRNAIEVGRLARTLWFNEGLDVRFPNEEDTVSLYYSKFYGHLMARNRWIESKLLASAKGKALGWSNEDVKLAEQGINPDNFKMEKMKGSFIGLVRGSQGREVWQIQNKLQAKGYQIPVDGVFGLTTENTLLQFQSDNDLFGSGMVDEETFESLMK